MGTMQEIVYEDILDQGYFSLLQLVLFWSW